MNHNHLRTERLLLRPIEINDTDLIWPFVSNPNISRLMSWEPHQNKLETAAFLKRTVHDMQQSKSFTWAIIFESDFCGIISLISILRNHRALTYNRAELAYWLGEQFQRKGIMTEAGEKVIEFAFNELGLNRLVVGHVVQNSSSEQLIKRWRFKYIGTEREAFSKYGQWFNHKLYELLESDWRDNKTTL